MHQLRDTAIDHVRRLLAETGLSQRGLAQRIGWSQASISRLLAGNQPTMGDAALQKLGELLQVPIAELVAAQSWNPFEVTAADIEQWAQLQSYDVRSDLPELVSRLVSAWAPAAELLRCEFKYGAAGDSGGWDGLVEMTRPRRWLPAGRSGWEVGSGAHPRTKANQDWGGRREDADEVDTFVFVTPRRFQDAEPWRRDRLAEGVYRAVEVVEPRALADWVNACPGVRAWLMSKMGRTTAGLETLEAAASEARRIDRGHLPEDVVVAGRLAERSMLSQWLSRPSGELTLIAGSTDEAVAFIGASIEPDAARGLCPVVVGSRPGWSSLSSAGGSGACNVGLVVDAAGDGDARARFASGSPGVPMLVIRVGTRPTVVPPATLALGPLDSVGVTRALEPRSGYEDARRAGTVAERGYTALLAHLGRDPWPDVTSDEAFLPFVFVEGFDDQNEQDHEALAGLGVDLQSLRPALARLADSPEGPVENIGEHWRWRSHAGAWKRFGASLRDRHLDRLFATAESVLSEAVAPPETRGGMVWRRPAHERGEVTAAVRLGLARSLALVAQRPEYRARVEGLVDRVFGESSARRWEALRPVLKLLAEAAPDAFLGSLERLMGQPRQIATVCDAPVEGTSGLVTPIMWALEAVSHSADHFKATVDAVVELAGHEPSARFANSPLATLAAFFRPWMSECPVGEEERAQILDDVVERHPTLGWRLLRSLLPSPAGGAAMPIVQPEVRASWRPAPDAYRTAARAHHQRREEAVARALQRLLEDDDGPRWLNAIDDIQGFRLADPAAAEAVVRGLEERARSLAATTSAEVIRAKLRDVVGLHRRCADKPWAIPESLLTGMERALGRMTSDALEARIWIFGPRPSFSDGAASYGPVGEARLRQERADLLRAAISEEGVAGARRVAVAAVDLFGGEQAVGRAIGLDKAMRDLVLEAEWPRMPEFWNGLFSGIEEPGDLRELAERFFREGDRERLGLCLGHLPLDAVTLAWVSELPEMEDLFWERVRQSPTERALILRSVDALLARGLVAKCAGLVVSSVVRPKLVGEWSETIGRTLEAWAESADGADNKVQPTIVEDLLDRYVDETGDVDGTATFEIQLLGGLRDGWLVTKHVAQAMSRSPDLFVDLVRFVYRRDDAEDTVVPEEAKVRAVWAYRLLAARGVGIHPDSVETWVPEALRTLAEDGYARTGRREVGRLLGRAPPDGEDGYWPHRAVRDAIERYWSLDLQEAVVIGHYNNRGVVTAPSGDEGKPERELAASLREASQACRTRWPRTAGLLRRLANSYEDSARQYERRGLLDG